MYANLFSVDLLQACRASARIECTSRSCPGGLGIRVRTRLVFVKTILPRYYTCDLLPVLHSKVVFIPPLRILSYSPFPILDGWTSGAYVDEGRQAVDVLRRHEWTTYLSVSTDPVGATTSRSYHQMSGAGSRV